jgi:hypothetical protein
MGPMEMLLKRAKKKKRLKNKDPTDSEESLLNI